jgi:hypothetical protein
MTPGEWSRFNVAVELSPIDDTFVFNAGQGSVLSTRGVTLDIAPNAFIYPDGTLVDGDIQLMITAPDIPKEGLRAAPGSFIGINDDDEYVDILSFGYFDLQAWQDGEPLNLSSDDVVEVTYTLSDGLPADTLRHLTDDVPLWWWDPDLAKWDFIEDVALVEEDDGTRSLTTMLPHFSSWNYDSVYSSSCVEVAAIDLAGNFIDGAQIQLTGTSYTAASAAYTSAMTVGGTTNSIGGVVWGLAGGSADVTASIILDGEVYSESVNYQLKSDVSRGSDCPYSLEIELPLCLLGGQVSLSLVETGGADAYRNTTVGGFGYFFEPSAEHELCSVGYQGFALDSCTLVEGSGISDYAEWGLSLVEAGETVRFSDESIDADLEHTTGADSDAHYVLNTLDVNGLSGMIRPDRSYDLTIQGDTEGLPGAELDSVITMRKDVSFPSLDTDEMLVFDQDEPFSLNFTAEQDELGVFVSITTENADTLFCRFEDDGSLTIPASDLQSLETGPVSVNFFRADEQFFRLPYGALGRANSFNMRVLAGAVY